MADSEKAANVSNPAINVNDVKTTPYSWFIAILVLLTYAVSFICRNVWTTAIPIAAPSLGMTMAAAGGLMTAYYIGYVISNFITGFMVDSIGPRKTLALATLFTGLFTLATPFVSGYAAIFALRVGAGLSSGPLFSGVVKYQISYFSPASRATAMGFMMSGPALGMTIASAAFAPVINNQGWQQGFIYAAICAIAVAVAFFLLAKEQGASAARSSKSLTPEEKAAERKGLKEVVMKRSFIIGTIACFLSIGANNGFQTWIIYYFTEGRGFSLAQAGAIFGASSAVGLFSGTLSGFVSDILKAKKKVCYVGAASSVICTILLMTLSNNSALWIAMLFRGLLGAFMGTPLNALQAEAAAGPYAGRAMGIYNGLAQAGSIVFPLIFGIILDITAMNFTIVITTIACTVALCGILIALMDEKKAVASPK